LSSFLTCALPTPLFFFFFFLKKARFGFKVYNIDEIYGTLSVTAYERTN